MAEVVHALEGTLVPMQCFTEPGDERACSATTSSTATRTARPSCSGPASRAASTRALEQTTLAELVAVRRARRGAAAPKRSRAPSATAAHRRAHRLTADV